MTPEQELAQALSSLPSTQMEKVAAAFSEMNADELSQLLRNEDLPAPKVKTSAAEKLQLADSWGRELAQTHFQTTKEAALAGLVASGSKKGLSAGHMAAGAGVAGLAAGSMMGHNKAASVLNLEAALEKTALPTGALSGIGGKLMGMGKSIMQNPGVKKGIGTAGNMLSGNAGKALAVGAGGGAAMGAMQRPQPGGSRIGGALRGAAMGAGLAAGAGAGVKALKGSSGTAGNYLRGAMKAAK